eukprot:429685_1
MSIFQAIGDDLTSSGFNNNTITKTKNGNTWKNSAYGSRILNATEKQIFCWNITMNKTTEIAFGIVSNLHHQNPNEDFEDDGINSYWNCIRNCNVFIDGNEENWASETCETGGTVDTYTFIVNFITMTLACIKNNNINNVKQLHTISHENNEIYYRLALSIPDVNSSVSVECNDYISEYIKKESINELIEFNTELQIANETNAFTMDTYLQRINDQKETIETLEHERDIMQTLNDKTIKRRNELQTRVSWLYSDDQTDSLLNQIVEQKIKIQSLQDENNEKIIQINELKKENNLLTTKIEITINKLNENKKLNSLNNTMEKLQQEINILKKENKLLNEKLKNVREEIQLTNNNYKRQLNELRIESEQYRFAAISYKEESTKLPSADMGKIEWEKIENASILILRSQTLDKYKKNVQQKMGLKEGEYMVENNPNDVQYDEYELNKYEQYIQKNGIYNHTPQNEYGHNKYWSQDQQLKIRKVTTAPNGLEILIGQNEAAAAHYIKKWTVLGQYIGNELTADEFYKIYNGTEDEKNHMMYRMETILDINGEKVEVIIDAFAGYNNKNILNDKSFLLRINDVRKDLSEEPTDDEEQLINVRFVSILCNGLPVILVEAVENIKINEALWMSYSCKYGNIFDEFDTINDQTQKMIGRNKMFGTGIDLRENEPFDVELLRLSNENRNKKRRLSDSESSDDNHTTPLKKQRLL